jgi:hypothetical protein
VEPDLLVEIAMRFADILCFAAAYVQAASSDQSIVQDRQTK